MLNVYINNGVIMEKIYKIEMILKDALDPKESNDFCHRLVLHGRAVCDARKPKCEQCCMKEFCETYLENEKNS